MRRKKLLRQVAAAAVALSMAVSLSAPAFAAVVTFNLSDGGLVIKADESGITVTQDGKAASTIGDDDEIEITGTYNSTGGAMQTAEENRQEENQPVTPAKAPAKEETSEETSGAENAPAAEEKQEDTEAPADLEQKTETENKDNNSDPADEEKKEQNAPANGELNASAGERQDEERQETNTEAKASAEATASASDDASNGPREAQARSSGQGESSGKGERNGIIQIFNNTVDKLVKLTLHNATIDQPHEADTSHRCPAAIDIQGSGGVQITVKGDNLLTGNNGSAAIQKNGDVSTGNLTITAQDTNQKLTVKEGGGDVAIGGRYGAGTKNIEINNGTIIVDGTFGSDYGNATGIKITGDAVVNVTGDIRGGSNSSNQNDIEFSGNANVTVNRRSDSYSNAKIGGNENGNVTISGNAQVRGDWVEINCNLTLKDQAKLEAIGEGEIIVKKDKLFTDETSDGAVLDVLTDIGPGQYPPHIRQFKENGEWKVVTDRLYGNCNHEEGKTYLSETIPSTCNTRGKKIYRCFYCGSVAKTEYMDCLPHTWVKGETVAPTCTQKGYTVYKCSVCGQTENKDYTDVIAHTWVKGETVAPTYTERGYTVYKCQNCDATEQRDWVPMLERESTNGAPNYTVTGAETYETSVVDGRYIIAVPSEEAALNAVLGDLRAIKAQGADVVVFRTRSRESSLVIDEMLAMGPDATPFVLAHNGGEAQLTINGAAHNELIH